MKTAYVVLGMHRSGTSAVAGSLAMAGVTAPASLMPPKPDNPLGFWESERIVDFNDHTLGLAGSSWDDWGPLDPAIFQSDFRNHFVTACAWILHVEFHGGGDVVIKDPRICRFYPFWQEQLTTAGYRPVAVLPIRSPHLVVRSLGDRNGLPSSRSYRLWLRHVLDAERDSRSGSRHIVTLDDLALDWRGRFERISTDLDIDLDWRSNQSARKIDEFWSRQVDQEPPGDPQTWPALVRRTWAIFQDISARGETPEALSGLDKVRSDLNALMPLFYDGPGAR